MVLVYFQMVFYIWDLVFETDIRIRSPCFFEKSDNLTKICKKDRV